MQPVFEYDERKLPGLAHETVFESRCIVSSKKAELEGTILCKEAKGASIKAAREASAKKVVQYLLSKDSGKAQSFGSQS